MLTTDRENISYNRINIKIIMLIHKSFESIVNMLALFWLAWTVTIQSGANRNGALWSLTSMCTVNITKQHILYKCMKLDKAVFTWQGRRNHGGQRGHCDPPPPDKGQLISKANFKVFIWTKKRRKLFLYFYPSFKNP